MAHTLTQKLTSIGVTLILSGCALSDDRSIEARKSRYQETITSAPPLSNLKFFVNEQTSDAVKALYPQFGARSSYIVGGMDPDNTGIFTGQGMQAQIEAYIPEDFAGPLVLDWEGLAIEQLSGDLGPQAQAAAVQQYVLAIQIARQLRPLAQIGFYGLPLGRHCYGGEAVVTMENLPLQAIFDASDALFPSNYDPSRDAEVPLDADRICTHDHIRASLGLAGGKPVLPYVWHRYHPSNAAWGYRVILDSEIASNLIAAFEVEVNGDRADGVVWWGADRYFRWLSLQNIPPGHSLYAEQQTLQAVFNAEIPSGMSDETYFDGLHTRVLQVMSTALWTAETAF